MHRLILILLLLAGCVHHPAVDECPVVAQRASYKWLERWHDCDGDSVPEWKTESTFVNGKLTVVGFEEDPEWEQRVIRRMEGE